MARASDPQTSHEAAQQAVDMATQQLDRVYYALTSEPLGAEQVAQRCGLPAYTVRKRLPELQRLNLAAVCSPRHRTSSGRMERTWMALAIA